MLPNGKKKMGESHTSYIHHQVALKGACAELRKGWDFVYLHHMENTYRDSNEYFVLFRDNDGAFVRKGGCIIIPIKYSANMTYSNVYKHGEYVSASEGWTQTIRTYQDVNKKKDTARGSKKVWHPFGL